MFENTTSPESLIHRHRCAFVVNWDEWDGRRYDASVCERTAASWAEVQTGIVEDTVECVWVCASVLHVQKEFPLHCSSQRVAACEEGEWFQLTVNQWGPLGAQTSGWGFHKRRAHAVWHQWLQRMANCCWLWSFFSDRFLILQKLKKFSCSGENSTHCKLIYSKKKFHYEDLEFWHTCLKFVPCIGDKVQCCC